MPIKEKITASFIKNLSYSNFIGFINQWNTPPGSYSTISKLAIFSKMTDKSYILEIACTTGFSSRELATLTDCSGLGIDLSHNAIKMAEYNKKIYAPNIKMSYQVLNGYELKPKNKFSHIMIGGSLAFFSNPKKMMDKCVDMLDDSGYILATPYYTIKRMPKDLISRTHEALGIPMKSFSFFSYKEVMKMYNKFEIMYEDHNDLISETDDELEYYCKSVIERACLFHKISDPIIYQIMYKRLLGFRKLINEGRPYQKYCVLVLKYRDLVYPNRYVALF